MKVGIDVSQVAYGTGVSDYTVNLVSSLQKLMPPQDLVLTGFSLRSGKKIRDLIPQSRVIPIPPSALHLLWNKLHVGNIELFTGKIDVFHSSDWTQPPSVCPAVTTIHDLSPFLFPEEMTSGRFRNIRAVHSARMEWVIKECQKIICVSQHSAQDLQQLFPATRDKIVVIPEALPQRFNHDVSTEYVESMKKKYQCEDYVVSIGTLQPRKNIPRLVRAFIRYRQELNLPQKLVVIGGTGWGGQVQDPSVIYTGYLPDEDVLGLIKGASAFVYTSLYEGFGLPILISFRHKIPVVTSRTSSLPEVAGNAAVLVDPKDEKSIAEGIAEAIHQKQQLVSKGVEQLKKFEWDGVARKTLDVYSSVC